MPIARLELSSIWGKATVVAKLLISSGRNRHATPFCISEYLHNRPRAGGTTSQGAKLVGCHVKIASSGTKRKSNPTGGAEGSEISGLPKAGERTKTQRFKKKSVLERLHQKIGGLWLNLIRASPTNPSLAEPRPRAGVLLEPALPMPVRKPQCPLL